MVKKLSYFITILAVSGCVSLTPENLAKMNDVQVCSAAKVKPLDMAVINETKLRKLSCHPAVQMCTASKGNKKEYSKCLEAAFAQLQAHENDVKNSWQTWGNALSRYGNTRYAPGVGQIQQPASTQTNCTRNQFGMNCTSY